jgi:hypothetical protein
VTFAAEASAPITSELATWFGQAAEHEYLTGWSSPPWAPEARLPHERSARTAFFADGASVGFFVPAEPEQLTALRRWLEAVGIEASWLSICAEEDLVRFKTIASARCSHCEGRLKWLDRRTHAIEADQLACDGCGGMFDLASFTVE